MQAYLRAARLLEEGYAHRMCAMLMGSNLDILCAWDADKMQAWVDAYASEELRLPESLATMRDVADALLYLVARGEGREIVIEHEALARDLEREASGAMVMIGSTAAQASCAAASAGLSTLLCPTVLSADLLAQLPPKHLYVLANGKLALARAMMLDAREDAFAPHFVFQFAHGASLRHRGKTYEAPYANRLIATYDPVNKDLPIREEYLDYVQAHASTFSSLLIAGFHTARDVIVVRQRAERIARLLDTLEKSEERPVVTLELASYAAPNGVREALRCLSGRLDLISCNEDELARWRMEAGQDAPQGLVEVIAALASCIGEYEPRLGMIFHTREAALYVGQPCPFDIERALALGNMLSGAKARFTSFATREQACAMVREADSDIGRAWANEAYRFEKPGRVCVVSPAKTLLQPACTIGLGDSFIAGVQIGLTRQS